MLWQRDAGLWLGRTDNFLISDWLMSLLTFADRAKGQCSCCLSFTAETPKRKIIHAMLNYLYNKLRSLPYVVYVFILKRLKCRKSMFLGGAEVRR